MSTIERVNRSRLDAARKGGRRSGPLPGRLVPLQKPLEIAAPIQGASPEDIEWGQIDTSIRKRVRGMTDLPVEKRVELRRIHRKNRGFLRDFYFAQKTRLIKDDPQPLKDLVATVPEETMDELGPISQIITAAAERAKKGQR